MYLIFPIFINSHTLAVKVFPKISEFMIAVYFCDIDHNCEGTV